MQSSERLQGTLEWYAARVGKLTASRYSDAMARIKNGDWGATRERYRGELVAERLTGQPYPSYQSLDMKWGTECQPLAKTAYAMLRDVDIEEVGFVPHPTISMSGASPDGLIGSSGLVEFKCPATHTHLAYRRGAAIPGDYILQIQWQLICTGREWCDWVSFDPRLPVKNQLCIRRVRLVDPDIVLMLERDAIEFLEEVEMEYEAELLA